MKTNRPKIILASGSGFIGQILARWFNERNFEVIVLTRLPFGLPAPLWILEIGAFFLRTETELIIKSRRVVPARLEATGFTFRFREMENAVQEIENRITRNAKSG